VSGMYSRYNEMNERRLDLTDKEFDGSITEEEKIELERLDNDVHELRSKLLGDNYG